MSEKFVVTVELSGRNETHPTYPLLPGDIVTREIGGTWRKQAPGLSVGGFALTDEDVKTLESADDAHWVLL